MPCLNDMNISLLKGLVAVKNSFRRSIPGERQELLAKPRVMRAAAREHYQPATGSLVNNAP